MFPANPDERYVAAADGVAPLSEGTRAWLGAAYAKHKEMVAGMLRRPDVSPESARELLQDAYLTLGERAAGGLIPENTAAMLVTIIGLAVCNRGRRRKRRPSFDDGACTDDLPGDLPDGERRLCALECERIVHAVLARMAPPDAELIRLVDLEELSH
jgi:DNA-directed RNA polymerase specialized sigma24 family protein